MGKNFLNVCYHSYKMPLNTKMELHDTPTSKLAEIKAILPVIL